MKLLPWNRKPRPWLMTWKWSHGLQGHSWHRTAEDAERAANKQVQRRGPGGTRCTVSVTYLNNT